MCDKNRILPHQTYKGGGGLHISGHMNHPSVIKHFISHTADLSWARPVKFNHHNSVAHCSGTAGKFPSRESMPPRPDCYGCLLTREEARALRLQGRLHTSASQLEASQHTLEAPAALPSAVRVVSGSAAAAGQAVRAAWRSGSGEGIRWQIICREEQVEGGVSWKAALRAGLVLFQGENNPLHTLSQFGFS